MNQTLAAEKASNNQTKELLLARNGGPDIDQWLHNQGVASLEAQFDAASDSHGSVVIGQVTGRQELSTKLRLPKIAATASIVALQGDHAADLTVGEALDQFHSLKAVETKQATQLANHIAEPADLPATINDYVDWLATIGPKHHRMGGGMPHAAIDPGNTQPFVEAASVAYMQNYPDQFRPLAAAYKTLFELDPKNNRELTDSRSDDMPTNGVHTLAQSMLQRMELLASEGWANFSPTPYDIAARRLYYRLLSAAAMPSQSLKQLAFDEAVALPAPPFTSFVIEALEQAPQPPQTDAETIDMEYRVAKVGLHILDKYIRDTRRRAEYGQLIGKLLIANRNDEHRPTSPADFITVANRLTKQLTANSSAEVANGNQLLDAQNRNNLPAAMLRLSKFTLVGSPASKELQQAINAEDATYGQLLKTMLLTQINPSNAAVRRQI